MNPPNTFTRESILDATRALARRRGIDRVFKKHIAAALRCGMGTVNHHWGTMDALREEIRTEARRTRDITLLSGTPRKR